MRRQDDPNPRARHEPNSSSTNKKHVISDFVCIEKCQIITMATWEDFGGTPAGRAEAVSRRTETAFAGERLHSNRDVRIGGVDAYPLMPEGTYAATCDSCPRDWSACTDYHRHYVLYCARCCWKRQTYSHCHARIRDIERRMNRRLPGIARQYNHNICEAESGLRCELNCGALQVGRFARNTGDQHADTALARVLRAVGGLGLRDANNWIYAETKEYAKYWLYWDKLAAKEIFSVTLRAAIAERRMYNLP